VPVWLGYLSKMGFPVKGCVDLDFLWNGTGKVLLNDDVVSKFCEKFWIMAEKSEYCEYDKNGKPIHSLKNGNKKDAFKFIAGENSDRDLNQWAQHMFIELRKNNIWVLTQGEIEGYFGLSSSSKTEYVSVGQSIRSGKADVPDEIEKILTWLFE
jgi:hypothetical protein